MRSNFDGSPKASVSAPHPLFLANHIFVPLDVPPSPSPSPLLSPSLLPCPVSSHSLINAQARQGFVSISFTSPMQSNRVYKDPADAIREFAIIFVLSTHASPSVISSKISICATRRVCSIHGLRWEQLSEVSQNLRPEQPTFLDLCGTFETGVI